MRILIAEDDAISRRMLEVTLKKWDYDVVVACDGVEAWGLLQKESAPPIAILDWMMPGLDGLEVCRLVRQQAREPYTYILLLTAKGQKQDIIEGMEGGADDYLTKPFNPHELKVRLRAGRRIIDLQDELITAREKLRDQATHDGLTGVLNRAAIIDMLQRELPRARRRKMPIALLMADMDNFKRINDTYGHLSGDAVLREATRRMRDAIRPYDAIGRYGGEEFLIVVPGCDSAFITGLAERLQAAISDRPMNIPEGMLSVTMSLGIIALTDVSDYDSSALIRAADTALYRAKHGGRNRYELATPADLMAPVTGT